MSEAALIWSPIGTEEQALQVAGALLDEGLIACANIIPAVTSLFVWKGERGEARESGLLLKTRADLLDAAIARLEQLHPYDVPAIAGWVSTAASGATIEWLGGLTGAGLAR